MWSSLLSESLSFAQVCIRGYRYPEQPLRKKSTVSISLGCLLPLPFHLLANVPYVGIQSLEIPLLPLGELCGASGRGSCWPSSWHCRSKVSHYFTSYISGYLTIQIKQVLTSHTYNFYQCNVTIHLFISIAN